MVENKKQKVKTIIMAAHAPVCKAKGLTHAFTLLNKKDSYS